jgi:hypothetical protein
MFIYKLYKQLLNKFNDMKAFFEAIQSLFVDFLFLPFDGFRALELKTWWGANIINWVFFAICCYYSILDKTN